MTTLPPDVVNELAKAAHAFANACHRATGGMQSATLSGEKAAAFDALVCVVEAVKDQAAKLGAPEDVLAWVQGELNGLGTGHLSDVGHYRREELCDAYRHLLNASRKKAR